MRSAKIVDIMISGSVSGFDNWLTSRVSTPTFIGVHMILDMHTLTRMLIFPPYFKVLKILWIS